MYALFRKELNSFFSSLTGYIVVIVFLVVNAIFLWLLPGRNLLDYGYADLSPFFRDAPYIFLLLVPAITMRSFAEEKSLGTIETLFTKPVSETRIILAKYLACIVLVIFALIPTVVYYISLYRLGSTPGNIDTAGIIGSYLGLLFLASVYISIGLFASSLTDNQIVSLIFALFLCLVMTEGFRLMAGIRTFRAVDLFLLEMGVVSHYDSISRGVIDSRDVIYFLSANFFFLLLTHVSLSRRKW